MKAPVLRTRVAAGTLPPPPPPRSVKERKKEKVNKFIRKKTQGWRARGPQRGSPGRLNDGLVQRVQSRRCGPGSTLPDKC